MTETVARVVGRRVHEVSWDGLDEGARRRLLRLLLTNTSVALAGLRYTTLPRPRPAPHGHAVFGNGQSDDVRGAVLFNAAAMHARTQDDFSRSHSGGHVGTCVVPALIAAAERHGASGRQFLEALAAGYLTQVGMARPVVAETMRRGFRSVSLYGAFGASAAVAKLRGFDADAIANTLALTASTAAGIGQCWIDGSDEWQVHPGLVATNALDTTDLTAAGVRGAPRAFEGSAGFFRAYAGADVTAAQVDTGLDAAAAIADVTVKRHPVSGICQPVVDVCEALAEKRLDPDAIESVVIEMHPNEAGYPGTSGHPPFGSVAGSLMSAAYCAAAVFRRGTLVLDDLYDHAEPARADLARRVQVVPTPDRPYLRPLVRVRLTDGSTLEQTVEPAGTGEPALDGDGWLGRLWTEPAQPGVPLNHLRDAIDGLPDAPDLTTYLATVTQPAATAS